MKRRERVQQIREGAFTDEEIEAEFTELKVSLEQETEQGKFVELVRGINLKRTLIVMAVNFYQQAGGQAFVSQYGTIYVKSLGTINPFGFSLITSAISIVSITCILLWTDIVGRRYVFCLICIATQLTTIQCPHDGLVCDHVCCHDDDGRSWYRLSRR